MLVAQRSASLDVIQPQSQSFFNNFFQCCSPKPEYQTLPYAHINNKNNNIYNLNQYSQPDNMRIQQQQFNQNMVNNLQVFPQNNTEIVVQTPIIITNQTSVGQIIQTPAKITQKVSTTDSIPSLASQPLTNSMVGQSPMMATWVRQNNMMTTAVSENINSRMQESTTYNMEIFNNRINLQKTQLQYITQLAYQYGYQKGMKNGKKASDKQMQQKLSRLQLIADKQSRLNIYQTSNKTNPIGRSNSLTYKPIADKNIRKPGIIVNPMSRVQINYNTPMSKNIAPNKNIKNVPIVQRGPQSNLVRRRF